MASPTVVAETPSSSDISASTFTINTGSPQDGEGVLIVLSRDGGAGTVTWTDGYIELYDLNGDDGRTSGSVAYKQAGASEPATTDVTTSMAGEFAARAYRVTGHLDFSTQAPDFGVVTSNLNATIHDPPSVNVTGGTNDILSLALLPHDTHTVNTDTFPSGYISTGTTKSGASGSQCALSFCYLEISAVSSEDPSAFVLSATRRALPTTVLIQADDSGTNITANQLEAGDTTTATIVSIVAITANQDEAGDTTSANLETIVVIAANQTEAGDITAASISNIVGITANQDEAGDTTSANLETIVVIAANQTEAGDITAASISNIVGITANQNEAGDITSASVNTAAALMIPKAAADGVIDIIAAFSGQTDIAPAYLSEADIS